MEHGTDYATHGDRKSSGFSFDREVVDLVELKSCLSDEKLINGVSFKNLFSLNLCVISD